MIKIVIVDDHKILLEGLVSLLQNEANYQVVAHFTDGKECLDNFDQYQPDILISDIEMPKMDGIQLTNAVSRLFPYTRILALTSFNEHVYVKEMLKAGASGYLLKNAGIEEFRTAIDTVMEGKSYYAQEVMQQYLENQKNTRTQLPGKKLSKREIEIIKLLSDQFTTSEIAEKLYLSPLTIKTHRKNILLKLGLHNTAGVVKYAMEKGII